MHLPDHLLDPATSFATTAIAAGGLGIAASSLVKQVQRPSVPTFVATSALVFAAQMVNYALPGGFSGHVLGATLAVWLLGLPASVLAMGGVVTLQCLLLGDGGAAALGANLCSMALAGVLSAAAVITPVRSGRRGTTRGTTAVLLTIAAASLISVVAAALACSAVVAVGTELSAAAVFAEMIPSHSLVGVTESVLTVIVVAAVMATEKWFGGNRPVHATSTRPQAGRLSIGLVGTVAVFTALATPVGSTLPDAMEASLETAATQQQDALRSTLRSSGRTGLEQDA